MNCTFMNRNVLVLALFCFIVLESSEDKKCSAEDFSLVQSPKLKKVKHDSAAPELQQNPIALPAPIAPIIQKQPQQKINISVLLQRIIMGHKTLATLTAALVLWVFVIAPIPQTEANAKTELVVSHGNVEIKSLQS